MHGQAAVLAEGQGGGLTFLRFLIRPRDTSTFYIVDAFVNRLS